MSKWSRLRIAWLMCGLLSCAVVSPALAAQNVRCETGVNGAPYFSGCTLFFFAQQGAKPAPQSFTLTTDASHSLSGTVSRSDAWIGTDPARWSTDPFSQVSFEACIDTRDLPAGIHFGSAFGFDFSEGTAVVDVVVTIAGQATSDGFIELLVERSDDPALPSTDVFVTLSVGLDDDTVSSVTLSTPQAAFPLSLEDDGWSGEFLYASFEAMQTALEGPFTVEITGGPLASTSTFDFTATALQDFATSSITNPLHDASDVASDVTFEWTDPTGDSDPDRLELEVMRLNGSSQQDDSDSGTLAITDTSWQPPSALSAGDHEFENRYVTFEATPISAPIEVTAGSIIWGDSPSAPPCYPANTPLLTLEATSQVAFNVPEPGAAPLAAAILATLCLLARSRR